MVEKSSCPVSLQDRGVTHWRFGLQTPCPLSPAPRGYGEAPHLLSLSFPLRREGISGSQKDLPEASGQVLSCVVRKFSSREAYEIKPTQWKVLSKLGSS